MCHTIKINCDRSGNKLSSEFFGMQWWELVGVAMHMLCTHS